MRQLNRTRW